MEAHGCAAEANIPPAMGRRYERSIYEIMAFVSANVVTSGIIVCWMGVLHDRERGGINNNE